MSEDVPVLASMIADHLNAIRWLLRRSGQADLAAVDLTPQQVALILELIDRDGLTLSELSARLRSNHSTVSGIVDRLEHKGLVHRRADAQDRRFVHIQLDPQVTEYLSGRMPSSRSSLLTGALRRADASQRELILCGLAALRQLLEAKPGSPRAPGAGGHEL